MIDAHYLAIGVPSRVSEIPELKDEMVAYICSSGFLVHDET